MAKVGDDAELEVDFGENTRVKVVKSMIISVRGKSDADKRLMADYAAFLTLKTAGIALALFLGVLFALPNFLSENTRLAMPDFRPERHA